MSLRPSRARLASGLLTLLVAGAGAGAAETFLPYRVDHQFDYDPARVGYHQQAAFTTAVARADCLASWPDGRLAVAGGAEWAIHAATGQALARGVLADGRAITALATHADRLYLATRDRVRVIDTRGAIVTEWEALGEAAQLTGIASSSNALWLCDAGQRRVWRLDHEGRLLGLLPSPGTPRNASFVIPSPSFDLIAAADGSFWVANPGRHQLQHYAADGALLGLWEAPAQNVTGFAGCCNPARVALLPDGRLVTSEKKVPRVKIYSAAGVFESFVVPPRRDAGEAVLPIAVTGDGTIAVLDGATIRLYTPRPPTP